MRILALVPYYGGESTAAPSPAGVRPGYLERTVASLNGFADTIQVGVVCAADVRTVNGLGLLPAGLDCEPKFIPAALCRTAQANLDGYDLVYVTEADQVLHCDPSVLGYVSGDRYLVPHRAEPLGSNGEGAHRGFCSNGFVFPNGTPYGDDFYHPQDQTAGYGGAFLASADLFARIVFPEEFNQPVENVTGFAAYRAGDAQKTSDWTRFYVEHLSAFDYHESLSGRGGYRR